LEPRYQLPALSTPPAKCHQRLARLLSSEGTLPPAAPAPLPVQAEKKRTEKLNKGMAERTIDAQRVSGEH
jgi:hypothetical protein